MAPRAGEVAGPRSSRAIRQEGTEDFRTGDKPADHAGGNRNRSATRPAERRLLLGVSLLCAFPKRGEEEVGEFLQWTREQETGVRGQLAERRGRALKPET